MIEKSERKNLESAVSIFDQLLQKLGLTRLFVRLRFGGAHAGYLEANGNDRKIWPVRKFAYFTGRHFRFLPPVLLSLMC